MNQLRPKRFLRISINYFFYKNLQLVIILRGTI